MLNENQLRYKIITGDTVNNMYPESVVIRQSLNPETKGIQSQRTGGDLNRIASA